MGVMRPELVMKSIVPVVMAGVLGIYGLIIAVIISTGSKTVSSCFQLLRGLRATVPYVTTRSRSWVCGSADSLFMLQSTRPLPAHTTCLMDMRILLLVYPVDWQVWLLVWLLAL